MVWGVLNNFFSSPSQSLVVDTAAAARFSDFIAPTTRFRSIINFPSPSLFFSFFFLSLSTLNNWGHLVSSDDDNDGSNSQKSFSFIFFLSHKTFFSVHLFSFFCSKNLFIFIIFHFGCVVVDTTQLLPQRRVSCSLMLMRNWNETPHKWMNRRKNYKFQFFSVSLFFCLLHFVGTFPAVLEIFSQRFFYVIINYYASL